MENKDHTIMPGHSNKLLRLTLFAALILGFFFNLHAVPLFDLDEGAFSEATREMFSRGDFISPYLNGEPRFDKPVFIHWLQAASVYLFGVNEFAFRLPSAIAATLWVLVIYFFTKTVLNERTALLAALFISTSLEIPIIAKAATADATLNLFLTASMLTAYLHYQTKQARYLFLTFLLSGLGFLTKGPVAIFIPIAVTAIFYISKGEFKRWVHTVCNPWGILLFLAVTVPWYTAQYIKEGDAFLAGFFLKHNVGRFSAPMEGHGGNIFYYIPVVILGVLPYTSLLFTSLGSIRTCFRDALGRYLWIWFLFVFLFFSLSGTKLPHYVVYGFSALFILMAATGEKVPGKVKLLLPPLLLFLTLLLLPELIAAALPAIKDAHTLHVLEYYAGHFDLEYRIFFAVACLLILYFMLESQFNTLNKLILSGFLTTFAIAWYIIPIIGSLQQSPIKDAALLAKHRDYTVVMWRLNTPSFNVYSERLTEKRDPQRGDVILTKSIYLSELGEVEVLYEKNGIALAKLLN